MVKRVDKVNKHDVQALIKELVCWADNELDHFDAIKFLYELKEAIECYKIDVGLDMAEIVKAYEELMFND